MTHGETSIEINKNINNVYKICKDNMTNFLSKTGQEVNEIEKKDNFLKLNISEPILGGKNSWNLSILFDEKNKTISNTQIEGPMKGLTSIWYFLENGDKTVIKSIHEFEINNIHIFKNLVGKFLYKAQMKPYTDKLLNIIKEEAERTI